MQSIDLIQILTLLGSLCLMLYGMKQMSENVQKLVGDRLREAMEAMTRNHLGNESGIFSLNESAAVVLGFGALANSWLIALLGFHCNFTLYAMPLLALSLPFFNSRNNDSHSWGELITGFSLLFVGIGVLQHTLPEASLEALIVLGVIMLVLFFVSANATLILSLVMIYKWSQFDQFEPAFWGGAFLLIANVCSHREQFPATILGSLIALPALWLAHQMEAWIFLPLVLTIVCICNLLVMVLIKQPWKKNPQLKRTGKNNQAFQPEFIEEGAAASGEMALLQVRKEVHHYAEEIYQMFSYLETMLSENLGSTRQFEQYEQIKQMEAESDKAEEEIADFLNTINPKTLSADSDLLSRRYYKMVDEMESVADSIYHMACTLKNKAEQRVRFNASLNNNLHQMIELTDASLLHMVNCLAKEEMSEAALNKGYNLEDEINNLRSQLRNNLIEMTDSGDVKFLQGTFYLDLINECERIGDFVMNVLAAYNEE